MIAVKVDSEIFPVKTVQMACYNLLERMESNIVKTDDGKLLVYLTSKNHHEDEGRLESLFYEELISASVNLDRLERNRALREYFAKTAFIPTTDNQQVLKEFLDQMKDTNLPHEVDEKGHAHAKEIPPISFKLENGFLGVELSKDKFLISDVLVILQELFAHASAKLAHIDRAKIKVELAPKNEITVEELRDRFLEKASAFLSPEKSFKL